MLHLTSSPRSDPATALRRDLRILAVALVHIVWATATAVYIATAVTS